MSDLKELAILGGDPTFQEELHVGRPNVGDRERLLERINGILDSRWFTNNGPNVQELEQIIAEKMEVKHCVLTCNGTVALEIAAKALGLTGEVIVPSFTFIATAHALEWQGITPVFCDIDPKTHNINPFEVERMITPRTTGIIGVHVWGRPCDVESLAEISRERNLKLIYDAAHAFGCSHQGRMIGNFGDAEIYSFHATKFFNTFEGGAVVTNDDHLASKIRLMKDFGFTSYDRVDFIGTNGKMTEISAAMGLTLFEDLDELIAVNYRHYKQYQKELAGIPGVGLIAYDETEKCNYQFIVLEIDESITHISRDQLLRVLWAENVLARRYFYPGCHKMEPYYSRLRRAGSLLTETERVSSRVLSFPTGTAIAAEDIEKLCRIVRLVSTHGQEVREKLDKKLLSLYRLKKIGKSSSQPADKTDLLSKPVFSSKMQD